ncbi:MAG: hypothetical protein JW963_24785 [Anaerolineales bacterium]|nr:hypothetical protein [Anaerolineales bacterium]
MGSKYKEKQRGGWLLQPEAYRENRFDQEQKQARELLLQLQASKKPIQEEKNLDQGFGLDKIDNLNQARPVKHPCSQIEYKTTLRVRKYSLRQGLRESQGFQ